MSDESTQRAPSLPEQSPLPQGSGPHEMLKTEAWKFLLLGYHHAPKESWLSTPRTGTVLAPGEKPTTGREEGPGLLRSSGSRCSRRSNLEHRKPNARVVMESSWTSLTPESKAGFRNQDRFLDLSEPQFLIHNLGEASVPASQVGSEDTGRPST